MYKGIVGIPIGQTFCYATYNTATPRPVQPQMLPQTCPGQSSRKSRCYVYRGPNMSSVQTVLYQVLDTR